ncbi:hypothetical protein P152DRAFT_388522 [Eremomyces bilateralis CBS 781.70]|uniref:Uncharacterized protein n=1 Tax=Eremomyces bilateralis CBS 781.70 TaxID=1392243 RepID=A0A6G1GE84_9PEZI|nr:uncharacterized protein P152DRAFT_388522 [Eremomyces bilateralis CBS 781.70]KAF1816368.1 hypothetical protein P152DRAFT_388522 [Eremomyces bilateralis CBS 781.70]
MGMYIIPAGLSFKERARRANVFPITLGPHGSNFDDVISALEPFMKRLDRGQEVTLQGGEKVLLCAFTMAYLGDMPQQQENAGMKSQRAKLGCRNCFIDNESRGDLFYDTFRNGRYHHQTLAMREVMNACITQAARERYATRWGLNLAAPSLIKISPALDLIMSRPGDPAHSEYLGLSRMMHSLLLDAILTTKGCQSYAETLRSFPFPPNWPHVQGPLRHLKSYSLSEHARWSLLQSLLQQAADSLTENPRRRRSLSRESQPTGTTQSQRTQGPRPGVEHTVDVPKESAAKAVLYLSDIKKPNMHTALHYPQLAEEYAMPSNCNVLVGEDKHRFFKKVIYQTNHQKVEREPLSRRTYGKPFDYYYSTPSPIAILRPTAT